MLKRALTRGGAFDDRPEGDGRDFLGLERLTRSLHNATYDLIERHQWRVGLGLHLDLPLSAVGSLESMTVSGREDGVAMHDDRAIFLLDGGELVARALAQRFGRLVGLVQVLGLGWQGNGGDHRYSGFDARLPQWRKQSHLINRVHANAVGYFAQE